MWIRRHWRSFVAFILFVWTVSTRVVGWAGSVDLVISRTQDPAWVGTVIDYLLNPSPWLDIVLIGGGLGLIWWDVRRPRCSRDLAGVATPAVPSLKLATAPAAVDHRASKPAEHRAAFPAAASSDVPPQQPTSVEASKALPGWEKLYRFADKGVIELRFLPDTKPQIGDALCLLLLGHKIINGNNKVPIATIEGALRQALRAKPKTVIEDAFGLQTLAISVASNLGEAAIDSGKVERVDLATGGSYIFTWWGEAETLSLAMDLIRRA